MNSTDTVQRGTIGEVMKVTCVDRYVADLISKYGFIFQAPATKITLYLDQTEENWRKYEIGKEYTLTIE